MKDYFIFAMNLFKTCRAVRVAIVLAFCFRLLFWGKKRKSNHLILFIPSIELRTIIWQTPITSINIETITHFIYPSFFSQQHSDFHPCEWSFNGRKMHMWMFANQWYLTESCQLFRFQTRAMNYFVKSWMIVARSGILFKTAKRCLHLLY